MKFSVIIPTYNRADLLKVCLESLVAQSFKDFEVIVCDDGSTDNSKEIVELFHAHLNLTYFYEENWGGPARPRNNGIRLSRGEWLAFLDSDDYWSSHKLETINNYISKGEVFYHRMIVLNEKNVQISSINSKDIKMPVFETMLVEGNRIPLSSVVCRKSKVLEAGGFSEEKKFIAVEDFDLWLKLSLLKCEFLFVPEFLGFYYAGGGNISQASLKQIKKLRSIYLKYLPYILDKSTKRQVIGSFYYQKFRMIFMMDRDPENYSILKKAFLFSNFKTKIKIIVVFIVEFCNLIALYRKARLLLSLRFMGRNN
ncbi:MAG: glycosyltransferase [Bacteriovorax sp.]|nr:glycosyltransferase [Bacteriovorax sp.]